MSGVVFSFNGSSQPGYLEYFMLSPKSIFFVLSLLSASFCLHAQTVQLQNMLVCPTLDSEHKPAVRDASNCVPINHVAQIDPQAQQLWVLGTFTLTEQRLATHKPLGLFISAKASTEVFINGRRAGANGRPAPGIDEEMAGVMDYVMYLPKNKLHPGENDVALRMSSHMGWLTLAAPVHFISLADYVVPVDKTLRHYWVTLLPFGMLLIGAFYMSVLAFARRQFWPDLLLPAMSILAACQLIAEVLRGLVPYLYWVHDIRLFVILACSVMFGAGLFLYTLARLRVKRFRTTMLVVVTIAILVVAIGLPGFDSKSAFALIVPTMAAFLVSAVLSFRSENLSPAKRFATIYAVFLLVILLSLTEFLDVTFYYVIAGLLIIMFVNEIDNYAKERAARLEEKTRADKLQTILEHYSQNDRNTALNVKGAGSVEKVAVDDIVFCKGAGDYVELSLIEGGTMLHSERLVELEKTLPSTFLRVHRSYIVNTAKIKSLQRKTSGVGELLLINGVAVPVSRRIMPSVRNQLS